MAVTDARPFEDAVIVVVPGVSVTVALATTYEAPAGMTIGLWTTATLCWDELRYTVMSESGIVGFPFESVTDRNTTEWTLPSAGRMGGTTFTDRELATDALEAAAMVGVENADKRRSNPTKTEARRIMLKAGTNTHCQF